MVGEDRVIMSVKELRRVHVIRHVAGEGDHARPGWRGVRAHRAAYSAPQAAGSGGR